MRLACVQSHVVFNDPAVNASVAVKKIEQLKKDGVELVVFPEAFLTGYCVECKEDAERISITIEDSSLEAVQGAVNEHNVRVILGFAENRDGQVFNTVALLEPHLPMRVYSKTHLPELGLDKFVKAGDEFPVFDTEIGKIGLLICFDLRPPEPARVMALKGAELIVLPTNWPQGAEVSAGPMAITRAAENRVFMATCDRVGTENGFTFIGLSKIISPTGKVLAEAGTEEDTIIADIDLAEARLKRNRIVPGKYETTVFECRRPELYESLVKTKSIA